MKNLACCACGAQLMPAETLAHTSDKLQRLITDATKPLLVYFHAASCTSCTLMTPIINRLAKKLRGNLCCAKIDARQDHEMASSYGVYSVPTIILFKNDREAKRFSGAMDIISLTDWIME